MLSGRLTRAPEQRDNKAGKLTKICIAVNRKVGGEEQASFFDIEGWDKMAERLATFEVGQVGFFEGDIQQNVYQAKKDGEPLTNEEGKPILRRDVSFKAYNCRYLTKSSKAEKTAKGESSKAEKTAKGESSKDDLPWD